MRASFLFLLTLATAFAQKKPITLQALEEIAAIPAAGTPGSPLAWSPDGTRFVFRQGEKLRIYSAATQTSSDLTDVAKLAPTPDTVTQSPQPFEWENRGVSETPVQ